MSKIPAHARHQITIVIIDSPTGVSLQPDRPEATDAPPGSVQPPQPSLRWSRLCTLGKIVSGAVGLAAALVTVWAFVH
jgi:hypothetical protein